MLDLRLRAAIIKSASYLDQHLGGVWNAFFVYPQGRVERLRLGIPRCVIWQCAD